MRPISFFSLYLRMLMLGLWVVVPALAQDKVVGTGVIPGVRGEHIEVLNYFEQRYVRLAEAVPAEKYTGGRRKEYAPSARFSSTRLPRPQPSSVVPPLLAQTIRLPSVTSLVPSSEGTMVIVVSAHQRRSPYSGRLLATIDSGGRTPHSPAVHHATNARFTESNYA